MGKTSSVVVTIAVILNTLVLAASLWMCITSARLRDQDQGLNIILPKVLNMYAYDAFAVFGSIALILVAVGYLIMCCCRDSCLNFQLGVLVLYVVVSGYFLYPLLNDYEKLDRVARGDLSLLGEAGIRSISNLFNNARNNEG